MVVFSKMAARTVARFGSAIVLSSRKLHVSPQCLGGHRHMPRSPGLYMWDRFKDVMHFYLFIHFGMMGAVIMYFHIYYPPAELAEIPDGYEPRYWEYEKNPLQRAWLKWFIGNPAHRHEAFLGQMELSREKTTWRKQEQRVRHLQQQRGDYKAWYYIPMHSKWIEQARMQVREREQDLDNMSHTFVSAT